MPSTRSVQKWVWILIYAGMALIALGLSVRHSDDTLGWSIAVPGIVLVAAGIVLIWIRSRMQNTKETP